MNDYYMMGETHCGPDLSYAFVPAGTSPGKISLHLQHVIGLSAVLCATLDRLCPAGRP